MKPLLWNILLCGRIELPADATGGQEFFYGPLGEVVKNMRNLLYNIYEPYTEKNMQRLTKFPFYKAAA